MQEYRRGNTTNTDYKDYNNRIYARKYDIDVSGSDRPEVMIPSSTASNQYTQRQNFTQTIPLQRNWPEQVRHENYTDKYNSVGNGHVNVNTFKPSREDDLLKKLDMYEQKYQLKGQLPRTPQANTQVRRAFDNVQLNIGRPQQNNNDLMVQQRRKFGYSNNNSPNREPATNNRCKAEGGLQRNWRPSLDLQSNDNQMFKGRRNDPIRVYESSESREEPAPRYQYRSEHPEPREDAQTRFPYEPAKDDNRDRDFRRQPRASYQVNGNIDQRNGRIPPQRQPPYEETRELKNSQNSQVNYDISLKLRSTSHSTKGPTQVRSGFDPRQSNEYRGQPNRGIYDYRQGPQQRYPAENRGHAPEHLARRQPQNLFTDKTQSLKTVENQAKDNRRPTSPVRTQHQRIPLAPKEITDNRGGNSYWNEEVNRRKEPRYQDTNDEREDRLRDIRRKVTPNEQPSTSFHLERSQKKQSLRERSEQLRQKMNEPSPLKAKLPSNNDRSDRVNKQNKQNIDCQQQDRRISNTHQMQSEPQKFYDRKRQPISQLDQQTPSKPTAFPLHEKKFEFEQDTYRKIETINDLNNKINERIRHILSSFNQETS